MIKTIFMGIRHELIENKIKFIRKQKSIFKTFSLKPLLCLLLRKEETVHGRWPLLRPRSSAKGIPGRSNRVRKWPLPLVLIFSLPFLGSTLSAEKTSDTLPLFQSANQSYEEGNFAAARDQYEKIAGQDLKSARLYFNLGNTYYRLGQRGRARLWYERALREDPADEDIRFNLDFVSKQVEDEDKPSQPSWRVVFGSAFLWFLGAMNAMFFFVLSVGLFSDREWIWWGRWVGGTFFAATGIVLLILQSPARRREGIVLDARAEARTGPGDDFSVGFVVPEGRKLILFETKNEWIQVGAPDEGLKGWLPGESIEPIRF